MNLTVVFLMFWGIFQGVEVGCDSDFWSNLPPPLGSIKYTSCRTGRHVHNLYIFRRVNPQ